MPSQALLFTARSWKWASSALAVALGFVTLGIWPNRGESTDAQKTDPRLLNEHSTFETYTTPTATYPSIRTFYHEHAQKNRPLLVFVHGLGGSTAQFAHLIMNLVGSAACLSVDLPGCGRSAFKPDDPKACTIAAFAALIGTAIERYRAPQQHVVLVGHSMGCSVAALLCSSMTSLFTSHIVGLVALCPRSGPPDLSQQRTIRRLRLLPPLLFDTLRFFDNIGGVNSPSIKRFCGDNTDLETRKLQVRFNAQSKSRVFLRHIQALAVTNDDGKVLFPGEEVWSDINVPLYLIAAESDTVCSVEDIRTIARWLTRTAIEHTQEEGRTSQDNTNSSDAALPTASSDTTAAVKQLTSASDQTPACSSESNLPAEDPDSSETTTKKGIFLKSTTFPAPASHALPYYTPTVQVLSGLIEDFVFQHATKPSEPDNH